MKTPNHNDKKFPIIPIILMILTIAAIPINMYLLQFSESIAIILSAGLFAADVFMWLKWKGKIAGKIMISLLCLMAICVSLFGSF